MTTTARSFTWNAELLDQLEFHWNGQLRPRLEGISQDEFEWEPVPGMWSVRRRGTAGPAEPLGRGEWVMDFGRPEPDPPPATTIGWRLNHLLQVLGIRSASHFGRAPVDYDTYPYAGDPATAIRQLDAEHDAWVDGVRALGEEGLARACGPAEGPFAEEPLAVLVLHIHREVIHHGAEIALLRDLYPHRTDRKAR